MKKVKIIVKLVVCCILCVPVFSINANEFENADGIVVVIEKGERTDQEVRIEVARIFEDNRVKEVVVNSTSVVFEENPRLKNTGYWQTNSKTTYYGDIFHFCTATIKGYVITSGSMQGTVSGTTASFSTYNNGMSVTSYTISNAGNTRAAVTYNVRLTGWLTLNYSEVLYLF